MHLPRCDALLKCPSHQQAKPSTVRTQGLLSFAADAVVQCVLKQCCTCSGTVCTQAMLSFAAHAVVTYVRKQCCLLLHMQCCKPAHFCQIQLKSALTLVVKERSSLAFTGALHDKLSYVCMKTPAGSVTVCPPLSPELPSTELTKHSAPSKFG